MPQLKANAKVFEAHLKKRGTYTVEGHPGLHLATRGDGNGSWRVRYRPPEGGNPRWHTLFSDAKNTDFDKVKVAKDDFFAELRGKHVDPKARMQAQAEAKVREKGAGTDTFGKLFSDWIERHAKVRKKSWEADEVLWKRHVEKRMARLRPTMIKRTDVIAILDDIASAATPTQANKVQALVSAVFSWGVNSGRVEQSPTYRLPKRVSVVPRERVLTDDEIRALWLAAAEDGGVIGDAIRILVLTGQRRSEVAGMSPSEVDIAASAWTIPSARTKNKIIHRVPLCRDASKLIGDRIAAGRPFVFAGRADNSTGFISPDAITRFIWKRKIGIPSATVHDIRRTVGTRMAEMRIPKDVRAAVLNHVSGARSSVTDAVYNQYDADDEKRRALRLWELRLRNIVSGKRLHALRWHA